MEPFASAPHRPAVPGRRVIPARHAPARHGAPHPLSRQAATVRSILDTALALERLSATVYYAALRTPAVLRTPPLAGRSLNPNDPGLPPGGHPQQVRYLQAALDAEVKHAALLSAAGAKVRHTHVYIPARALTQLGSAREPHSFLGFLDRLETLAVSLYTAAVGQLLQLGRGDLALLAAQIAGIESEHRMLARAIGDVRPANNLTLAPYPFATVAEGAAALQPFLTGRGIEGPRRVLPVPSAAQAARVIGKYGTRRVRWFF